MSTDFIDRLLTPPKGSFFLFGPRAVGKSLWLRHHFKGIPFFDLLKNSTYLELSRNPTILEAKIGVQPRDTWICIDEIQKIPSLLDEVHRLIEEKGYRFALSGSSARKLKRGGADLLAGRAITKRMEGFTFRETENIFDMDRMLTWGSLPLVVLSPNDAADILSTYVHTYIKEEIKEEGLVRKAEPFIRFLEIAGIINGQQVNKENIARDAMVPRSTVDIYFSILEDTLLGHFLPAFRPEAKVREQTHPKFYWFDAGVARGAAGLLYDPPAADWLGHSLETLLFHELRVYNHTQSRNRSLFFYRTSSGSEIDFIIETKKRIPSSKSHIICLELKYAKRWKKQWESPMRSLAASGKVVVEKMYGIYYGSDCYHFNGIDVVPVVNFLEMLHQGKIF